MTKKKPRETHLWKVDSSVFEPLPKAGVLERHVLAHARSLGKYTLYALAFSYPLVLVISGVMFGGLVFWTSLAGSMVLIWFVIKKTGYAANFASWDFGYRKFVGLFGAFGITLGIVYGLIYIRLWTVIIFGFILTLVLILGVWRASRR